MTTKLSPDKMNNAYNCMSLSPFIRDCDSSPAAGACSFRLAKWIRANYLQMQVILEFDEEEQSAVAACIGCAKLCNNLTLTVPDAGSGIPEVKVIISGFVLDNYLSLKTLLAKVCEFRY